jgi:CHAT domain
VTDELVSYLDFDLLIERVGRKYRARVLDSPRGSTSSIEFASPFTSDKLKLFLLSVGRPRQAIRGVGDPATVEAKEFGGRLYEAVFRDQLQDCYKLSEQEARRLGSGLRIRLHLDTPALADLPWEYLYDKRTDSFLALSVYSPVVRYLEIDDVPSPLRVDPPLRALVVISGPSDYPPLDVEVEWQKLSTALDDQVAQGQLDLQILRPATVDSLRLALLQRKYHILHFIGHGGFLPSTDEGVLVLENEAGLSRLFSGWDLGILVQDHPSLRLVVLNSCEGARGGVKDAFAGTAQSLIRRRVPAVIAMQFEISDIAAIKFTQAFYQALAASYPVDAALAVARKSVWLTGGDRDQRNETEWGTPVLYMLVPDGRVFSIPKVEPKAPVPDLAAKEVAEREAAAELAREQAGREAAEREAAELGARERAEQEAAAHRAREQAEREAREREEREAADREAAAQRAREQEERDAAERRAQARAERERAEAERDAAERRAQAQAERERAEAERRAREQAEQEEEGRRRRRKLIALVGIVAVLAVGGIVVWQVVGGSEAHVVVPGDVDWTDTGVDCEAGSLMEITVTGIVFHGITASAGPDGDPNPKIQQYNVVRTPEANHGSLIGYIDKDQPFFVGSSTTFICEAAGRLFLGPNDRDLSNNAGEFTATIRKQTPQG